MSDLALEIRDLGKMYHLGAKQSNARYSTVREQIGSTAKATIRKLLRRAKQAERRPTFWALKNVNLEIKRGDVVGIIGRNGAGKSTLLKILSQITEPSEGEINIYGRVGSLLEVGTGFHPELSGRENIFLNGAMLGMRRAEIAKKFDEIVEFSECEQFLDTPVKHYSSGMYTRLAFAVAAHLETEILIVDEVLAVGDAQFQKKCLGKMGDVAKGGRTVLFVSHQMGMIRSLCTSCVLLSKGSVLQVGPSEDIIGKYLELAHSDTEGGYVSDKIDDRYIIQILELEALGADNQRLKVLDQASECRIRITYRTRVPVPGANVCFFLSYNQTRIITSFDTDQLPDLLDHRPEGTFTYTLTIPGYTLKGGVYEIGAGAGQVNRTSTGDDHKQPPITTTITVVESGDSSLKGYSPARPGVLVSPWKWRSD